MPELIEWCPECKCSGTVSDLCEGCGAKLEEYPGSRLLREAREMLELVEWAGMAKVGKEWKAAGACHFCGGLPYKLEGMRYGHAPDCRLAKWREEVK